MTRPKWALRLGALVVLALLAVAGLAACGSDGDGSTSTAAPAASTNATPTVSAPVEKTKATLVLDFVPNAVHTGIYDAVAKGYYRAAGIDLKIIQPTTTADTLKLIDAGKADFGIADGIDVAGQIDLGRDAQGIMALVQRPLGGLITRRSDGITDPKQLEGKTVGITGVPSDTAVLDTIVGHAGGDPAKVRTVTIGFNGVQDLENGKISAFTGYWPADGVQVAQDGTPVASFKLDENGGPQYPGLVVFSTRAKIAQEPKLMSAFVGATVKGYEDALADPDAALADLLAENKALKRPLQAAQLKAYEPLFQADAPAYGAFQTADLRQLSDFLVANKLIKHPISPDRYATSRFLPAP